MKFIDLTYLLNELIPIYPGKTAFSKEICSNYEKGSRVDDIHLCTGIGTHMDAPNHFFADSFGIDQIPLEKCFAPLCLLHYDKIPHDDYEISKKDIENWEKRHSKIPENSVFVANTGWSKYWKTDRFCNLDDNGVCHYPGFSKEAAEYLVIRKVNGVGIDTMSIDVGPSKDYKAHLILLKSGIFLLENLTNLDKIPPTGAKIWALPMKIEGAPEAPVRAFAILET